MAQKGQLEQLYDKAVKIDDVLQTDYQGLLHHVMTKMIALMKGVSPVFKDLYRETYYGGSFFDGLKVGSAGQEFDLNIVLGWSARHMEVARVETDPKNFTYLLVTDAVLSDSEMAIVATTDGIRHISPIKMFNLLKTTVDRVLTSLGQTMEYEGRSYRVTRHEFAPVTLEIRAVDGSRRCEVDLLPAIKLELETLATTPSLYAHVIKICDNYRMIKETRSYMAVPLHKKDKEKFQLDFPDVQRAILYDRGCAKKVIKLLKYLRDVKGGPMATLWSYLLKVSSCFFNSS